MIRQRFKAYPPWTYRVFCRSGQHSQGFFLRPFNIHFRGPHQVRSATVLLGTFKNEVQFPVLDRYLSPKGPQNRRVHTKTICRKDKALEVAHVFVKRVLLRQMVDLLQNFRILLHFFASCSRLQQITNDCRHEDDILFYKTTGRHSRRA